MFKIEKNQTIKQKPDQRSQLTIELEQTLDSLKEGESFIFPRNKLFTYYRVVAKRSDSITFKSNKISDTEVRIFKVS